MYDNDKNHNNRDFLNGILDKYIMLIEVKIRANIFIKTIKGNIKIKQ